MSARDFFLGKRIAVIGLGPHGEMVADIKYLIKSNALVSAYDIRAEARVRNHIAFLRSIGLANHFCGAVPTDDLLDMDLISCPMNIRATPHSWSKLAQKASR